MIGSLVIGLPSRFTGGDFVVEHQGRELRAQGAGTALEFVAFYADCHHQVQPVRTGHRVVLTWNLFVRGGVEPGDAQSVPLDALAAAVRDFFDTPLPPSWSGETGREPPDRLVYLLDHEYTQQGLDWQRLKNADAVRAAALREVARRLDCEVFLALADVHEHWTCEDEYRGDGFAGWDDEDEDEEEDGDEYARGGATGEPPLVELIESDVELRHWLGADGVPAGLAAAGVASAEVCFTRTSSACEPFESEHEGYMGNWGNTVDRWYHRAAVVLWPRERTFVIRARVEPRWALGEIEACLDIGDRGQALALVGRLLPGWPRVTMAADTDLFETALRVAARLDDRDLAGPLLTPFRLGLVTSAVLALLIGLLGAYGEAWCATLLQRWIHDEPRDEETPQTQLDWIASSLAQTCRACAAANGRALAEWLLDDRWAWLREHADGVCRQSDAKQRAEALPTLGRPLLALLEASRIVDRPDLHARVLDTFNGAMPVEVALELLHAAHRDRRRCDPAGLGLAALHVRCLQELEVRLASPARARDDWSIRMQTGCACELCVTLDGFLRAPGEVRREWPLAEGKRRHVHGILDARDLPVRHVTRRTGRPFTLVLEKTAELFEREADERRGWAREHAWLRRTAAVFPRPPGKQT